MEICFLDIDGVLNWTEYGIDTYYDKFYGKEVALDQECIDNLLKLLEMFPSLKIVWSTDWRFLEDDYWYAWKHPLKHLEETYLLLKSRVIGKTPKKMSSERWHEVKWWLDEHSNEVSSYVILDDIVFPDPWFGIEKHCVTTVVEEGGFNDKKLAEAIFILKNAGPYVKLKQEERLSNDI